MSVYSWKSTCFCHLFPFPPCPVSPAGRGSWEPSSASGLLKGRFPCLCVQGFTLDTIEKKVWIRYVALSIRFFLEGGIALLLYKMCTGLIRGMYLGVNDCFLCIFGAICSFKLFICLQFINPPPCFKRDRSAGAPTRLHRICCLLYTHPAAFTPGDTGRGGFDEPPHLLNVGRFFEEGALFSVEPRAADAPPCPAPRDEARRPLLSRSLALSFPGFNERRVAPPRLSPGLSISSM